MKLKEMKKGGQRDEVNCKDLFVNRSEKEIHKLRDADGK